MSGQSTPILLHRTGNKCKYSQVAVSSFPSDTICIFHVRCAWRCPFKESNVRIHTSIIDTKYHVWLLQQQLANSRRPTSSNDVTPRHAAVASDVYAEFCVIIESNYCRKHIVLFPTDGRTCKQRTTTEWIAFSHVSLISATSWMPLTRGLFVGEDQTPILTLCYRKS